MFVLPPAVAGTDAWSDRGSQENVVKEALQRSLGLKSRDAMKTSVMAAEMGRQAIVKEQTKLKKLQEAIVLHVGKKPKMV